MTTTPEVNTTDNQEEKQADTEPIVADPQPEIVQETIDQNEEPVGRCARNPICRKGEGHKGFCKISNMCPLNPRCIRDNGHEGPCAHYVKGMSTKKAPKEGEEGKDSAKRPNEGEPSGGTPLERRHPVRQRIRKSQDIGSDGTFASGDAARVLKSLGQTQAQQSLAFEPPAPSAADLKKSKEEFGKIPAGELMDRFAVLDCERAWFKKKALEERRHRTRLQREIEELQRKTAQEHREVDALRKRKSKEDNVLAKAKQLYEALGAFMKAEERKDEGRSGGAGPSTEPMQE